MTDREILDAEKLIALMREDLSLISSAVDDVDRLVVLVTERVTRMFGKVTVSLFGGSVPDYESVSHGLSVMYALATTVDLRPDNRARLVDVVGKYAPRIDAVLEKRAQALAETENAPRPEGPERYLNTN